jgi:hypothetical protein
MVSIETDFCCEMAYIFNRHDLWDVHIDDLKATFHSPINVPLGNISLCISSQRLYSARLYYHSQATYYEVLFYL